MARKRKAAEEKIDDEKQLPYDDGFLDDVRDELDDVEDQVEDKTDSDSKSAEADSDDDVAAEADSETKPETESKPEEEPKPELPPEPEATQKVHLYQVGDFLRTIDRVFTEDEADAFVKMYSESNKHFGRKAFATEIDAEPPTKL